MSTALYRRYRPETFAEVIGQDHVTVPLTAALAKDRVNHAYLFSGPRGCGKTTSARILARCLNCAQGPTATPCGECDSCRDLARGGPGSLDVVEIDAASHGGVDDARSLRERAAFAPARDRFKVFIIDEAHMVSTQGFNALLKIVEEPPAHVRFVFATTEPEKVIGTIRSRTHHYPFRLVPPERLQAYLAQLCGEEGVAVGQGVLPLVVRAGAGSVRDSLSVLDQLIAGAGPEGLSYPMAVSLLGYTDGALLDDVVDGLAAGDGASVFGVVDRVIESGHDPRRFVEDLLERLRDLLVVTAVPDGGHAVLRALAADQLERMRGQAARFGRSELSRAADITNAALTEMTGATSPRLQLELLCARLLLPGSEDAERGLRARVDRIEKRMGVAGPAASALPAAGPMAPAAAAPAPVAAAPVARASVTAAPVAAGSPASEAPASARPVRAAASDSGEPVAAETSAPAASAAAQPTSVATPSATPAATPAGTPGGAAAPANSPASPAGSGPTLDTDGVRRMWPDVMAALSNLKRATWSLVSQHAQVLDYDGSRLLLGFAHQGLANTFTKGSHQEFLRHALIQVIGLECRIDATAGGPAGGPPAGQSAPRPAEPRRPDPSDEGVPAPGVPAGPPAEPAGWGPPSGRSAAPASTPAAARPEPAAPAPAQGDPAHSDRAHSDQAQPPSARSGAGLPADDAAAPARSERPPSGPASRAELGRERPSGRGAAPSRGAREEDIPPPDEPLPDDEPPLPDALPPEDVDLSRVTAPPAPGRPAAAPAAAARPASTRPASARPASARPASAPSAAAAPAPARAEPEPPGPARPVVAPAQDDEISIDDPDIEGSSLMGASLVEQLLGGRVIEERAE